jgi:hypothetical protein
VRSIAASFRELTLPFGVTTGGRIELDGVEGEIRIYDDNGNLLIIINSAGMVLYDTTGQVRLALGTQGGGFSTVQFETGASDETFPGAVNLQDFGVSGNRILVLPGQRNDQGSLELGIQTAPADNNRPSMLQVVQLTLDNVGNLSPIADLTGANAVAGKELRTVVHELYYGANNGHTNPPTIVGGYPRGMLEGGYAEISANSNSDATGNPFDINGLSITCDYVADHWYLITCNYHGMRSSVANDEVQVAIAEGDNTQRATNGRNRLLTANSNVSGGTFHYLHTPLVDEPNKVFKIRMDRLAGTGAVALGAAATAPSFIMAQDIGRVVP